MLFQTVHILLGLLALAGGFVAGRKIHHLRLCAVLWVVLLFSVSAMSPAVISILAAALSQAVGLSQTIGSELIGYATVFGGGIFFALTLPPPGTFKARSGRPATPTAPTI